MGKKGTYRGKKVIENPLTLTVEQAADEIGISPHLAWRLVRAGELPSIRLGKLVRISRATLVAFVDGKTEPWKSSKKTK